MSVKRSLKRLYWAVYLRTFGGLALEGADFRRPKLLLLLAYLTLEGPKDRRFLAELFWQGAAEPMTSLRMALTQLRRGVPEAFEANAKRVKATVTTDALRLLERLEGGTWAEAVRLYEGPFLQDLHLPGWSAELEEWVYSTREFLAEGVRGALLRLAEGDAAAGDFGAAARRAEEAWLLAGAPEPEPEEIGRIGRLLVAGGSLKAPQLQKEARAYGLTLSLKRDEARAQLAGALETRPARHNLRARATSFVGRDPELLELARLLAEPDIRLITVTGAGGVGKTRLALQAASAELQGGNFPDGVFFVSLEALVDAGLVPAAVAEALAVSLPGKEAPLAELAHALGSKALLLVLDNFEQLMAGATLVSELLDACPRLKLLVTSRERLNLAGEQLVVLGGLPLPETSLGLKDARYQDSLQSSSCSAPSAPVSTSP